MLRKAEYADNDDDEADGISLGAYSANEDVLEEDDYDYDDDFVVDTRRRRSRMPPRARYRGDSTPENRVMREVLRRLEQLEIQGNNARPQNSTRTSNTRNKRAATVESDHEDNA